MGDSSVDGPDSAQFHDYAPWMNAVCGLLVFLLRYDSPRPSFGVHWNLFLTGFVIMFAAVGAEIAHGNPTRKYLSAINVVAGVWLLVSAHTIPSILPVTLAQEGLGALVILLALATGLTERAFHRRMAERANGEISRGRYGARIRPSN